MEASPLAGKLLLSSLSFRDEAGNQPRLDRHREDAILVVQGSGQQHQIDLHAVDRSTLPSSGSSVEVLFKTNVTCLAAALSSIKAMGITLLDDNDKNSMHQSRRRLSQALSDPSMATLFMILDWSPCRSDSGPATTVQVTCCPAW
jgi:hypothetical protein